MNHKEAAIQIFDKMYKLYPNLSTEQCYHLAIISVYEYLKNLNNTTKTTKFYLEVIKILKNYEQPSI